MIGWLSLMASAAVVVLVVLTALMGWAGRLKRSQRISLCAMAAGLLWAGPARFLGYAPGIGDLMFVFGLLGHLWDVYGPALLIKADSLDGQVDGKLGQVVVLHRGAVMADPAVLARAPRTPRAAPKRR